VFIQEQLLLLDRWLSIDSVQNLSGAENPTHVAKCSKRDILAYCFSHKNARGFASVYNA
jgi:hypothetical protein